MPFVTIDPADAKDHDDAVHAAPDRDPKNLGGFVIDVAIADVAHYVHPGSALDREALIRGNSVYFPDRVVPMLPERISNDLCSLRPQEHRAALAVRMIVGADGRKRSHSFHRVMIRSAARLSYPQAQAAVDGWPDQTTGYLLGAVLEPTLLRPLYRRPEEYILLITFGLLMILEDVIKLLFGGTPEPACFAAVKNIGTFTPAQTERLSAVLTKHLSSALGVAPNRIYIEFVDAKPHLWGHDGGTFA